MRTVGSFHAFDAYAAGLVREAAYVVYLPVLAAIPFAS
jgi:hypothetical protein